MTNKPPIGAIVSADITVENANELKDFYSKVIGWEAETLDMGGYSDFMIKSPESGQYVAGICHSKGSNSDLPHQWIICVNVESIDKSLSECNKLGGKILKHTNNYALIEDPSGAVLSLVQT